MFFSNLFGFAAVAAALSSILISLQPQTTAAQLTPTAYTTSGGGFYTMTASMGIIRAWYKHDILMNNTTHFGGNSGGSWFQIQFSYSQDFAAGALGLNGMTVTEFVSDWGARYGEQMRIATESGLISNFTYELLSSSNSCLLDHLHGPGSNMTVGEFITNVLDMMLEKLAFPANNWAFYVNEMILPYIPNFNTTLFSSERQGFPKGTIVIPASLGKDAYQHDSTARILEATGFASGITVLPIQYISPDPDDVNTMGGWNFEAAGSRDIKVKLEGSLFGQHISFSELPEPSLAEVAAASSSAAGAIGSKTIMKGIIDHLIDQLPIASPLKFIAKETIHPCLPFGLQNTSAVTESPFIPSTISPWSPYYRYLDGGYTDGTSIAKTISAMQQSCIDHPEKYSCSNGLRLFNVISGHAEDTVDKSDNFIAKLFANCNCGTGIADKFFGRDMSYDAQVFAEELPSDLNNENYWTLYSNKTYPLHNQPSLSYALQMTVTTVENIPYGVTAGMKVDLILAFAQLPQPEEIIWTGAGSNFAFAEIYATTANEQYESMSNFFGEINLKEIWGSPSTITPPSPSPVGLVAPTESPQTPVTPPTPAPVGLLEPTESPQPPPTEAPQPPTIVPITKRSKRSKKISK